MPVFHLLPAQEGLDDPAWVVSWHQGPCQVVARNAEAARCFANGAFTIPVCPGGIPAGFGGLPWSQPRLVLVRELRGVPEDSIGPPGSVVPTEAPGPALAPEVEPSLPLLESPRL